MRLTDLERSDYIVGNRSYNYTIVIGILFDPEFFNYRLYYIEHKIAWNGIIFYPHHFPILAIFNVDLVIHSVLAG